MEIRNANYAKPAAFKFKPFTLTISNPVELTSLLGALIAYGNASTVADKFVEKIGLEEYYSGNVRKDARALSTQIAKAVGLLSPDFSEYLNSDKYSNSAPSDPGVHASDYVAPADNGYADAARDEEEDEEGNEYGD